MIAICGWRRTGEGRIEVSTVTETGPKMTDETYSSEESKSVRIPTLLVLWNFLPRLMSVDIAKRIIHALIFPSPHLTFHPILSYIHFHLYLPHPFLSFSSLYSEFPRQKPIAMSFLPSQLMRKNNLHHIPPFIPQLPNLANMSLRRLFITMHTLLHPFIIRINRNRTIPTQKTRKMTTITRQINKSIRRNPHKSINMSREMTRRINNIKRSIAKIIDTPFEWTERFPGP